MMKNRNRSALMSLLMGTGLYLLDPLRNRLADRLDDLTDRAQDTYDTASDRLGRATRLIRGDDNRGMSTTTAVLIGMGVGVGLGLLFAPAPGEETRSNLADKVHDFGGKVRDKVGNAAQQAAGNY
jgi:hypothetical protein